MWNRVARHPTLAVPHLSVDHIGQLDFEGLRAMGCKGIIFDKVSDIYVAHSTAILSLPGPNLAKGKT